LIDKMASARISVALCTHNGATYLPGLLESIATQERLPDELIICDDASTDSTMTCIEAFATKAPFPIHITENSRPLGIATNFSLAASLCRGDVVAFCDQDDILRPAKLRRIERALAADTPNAGSRALAVFHDAELIDATGRSTGVSLWKSLGFDAAEQRLFEEGGGLSVLLRHNVVTGATLALSAELLEIALPFSSAGLHDGWIGLLAAAMGSAVPIREQLIGYRQHGANQIGSPPRSRRRRLATRRALGDVSNSEATFLQEARARLSTRGTLAPDSKELRAIDDKIAHLKTRSALTGPRHGRVLPILREAMSGRYRNYGRGIESILYDMFFRP